MSSTLYVQPSKSEQIELSDDVKLALRKWLSDPLPDCITIESGDKTAAYLAGLAYAKVPGSKELLDAIERWGEVDVFEKW